jgi:hypothetical protein
VTHEDRAHLETRLALYRRRLQALELQEAQFGIYTPPHITLEIEDVKLKTQEIEQKLGAEQPIPATMREGVDLAEQDLRDLTELMLALPSMRDQDTRDAVLERMPRRITNAIRRNARAKVDVANIVLTASNYDQGFPLLLEALRFYDDGTTQLRALEAFLHRFGVA